MQRTHVASDAVMKPVLNFLFSKGLWVGAWTGTEPIRKIWFGLTKLETLWSAGLGNLPGKLILSKKKDKHNYWGLSPLSSVVLMVPAPLSWPDMQSGGRDFLVSTAAAWQTNSAFRQNFCPWNYFMEGIDSQWVCLDQQINTLILSVRSATPTLLPRRDSTRVILV